MKIYLNLVRLNKTSKVRKKIKKILKASEIETSKTKSSNIEESILNKIKK